VLRAGRFRKDPARIPPGKGVRAYTRDVEDALFVLSGYLTVGWEQGGAVVEQRLGPREVVFNPAGRAHFFRNDGVEDAEFLMIVGTPEPETVRFA
jgi:mannose-6-phosphate isomerase-like protein (cupin superfamily)